MHGRPVPRWDLDAPSITALGYQTTGRELGVSDRRPVLGRHVWTPALSLTQKQVAAKAGVSKNYITMLESGTRKSPSLPVLRRLARALRVPVTELLK
jgi:DNA-binding XRE family transcriptional regulator